MPISFQGKKGVNRDDSFWSKVDQQGPDDCWNWKASTNKDGYGQFWIGNTFIPAHRYAFILKYKRQIKEDNIILHHCDNPSCCNPNHLFEGTTQHNVDDKMAKGRHSYKSHPRFYEGELWLMRRLYSAGYRVSLIAKIFKSDSGNMWRILHNSSYTPKESYNV